MKQPFFTQIHFATNKHLQHLIAFILFLLLPFNTISNTRKVILGNNVSGQKIIIDSVFAENSTFALFDSITSITSLSVDASIIHETGRNYLVRVLLQGQNGEEFLVLESYRELNDVDTVVYVDYAIETLCIPSIAPSQIKVFVNNATFTLNAINIIPSNGQSRSLVDNAPPINNDSVRYKQVEETVRNINDYNVKHKKLWWAGITPLSLKSYEERKRILGMSDDAITGGIEYYEGGIFEVGDMEDYSSTTASTKESSPYVNHFDWRNRHGKNWITPSKDQGNSGYCVAFAVAGTTEAMVNLYYNNIINLDLSEQNLAACTPNTPDPYNLGMQYSEVLNYMRTNGICDEESYPFVDEPDVACLCDEIEPKEHVRIAGFDYIYSSANDYIKKALIEKGPLVSGFNTVSPPYNRKLIKHAMMLVGYTTIEVGDSIWEVVEYDTIKHSYGLRPQFAIEENDPRAGMTCWIFKDSYSKTRTYENGYIYMLFHNPTFLNETYSLRLPFTLMNADSHEVLCEDADGDGYFWWGMGPKPSTIPSWAQDKADGDDSNYLFGPMDEYGHLESISLDFPDVVIDTVTTWDEDDYLYNNVRVVSGGILTVTANVMKYHKSTITVESGGELIINGGTITRGNVVVKSNGKMSITGGGELKLSDLNQLKVEQSGIFSQLFGFVRLIN